jgi:protocatechuate 3,4-dioxygenase beta subunit
MKQSIPYAINRRDAVRLGLATLVGLKAGELILRADALPTEASGSVGDYGSYLRSTPSNSAVPMKTNESLVPTEDNILGPFYRSGSPFRAKVTPPLEPGKVVVVAGRVWGHDSKRPLAKAIIDIWQANAIGRYDNDDPAKPPKKGVYVNRARLVTDENGYYEFETIHPGQYQIGPSMWRPSHIHYLVAHPSYKTLVTQLYFEGDKYNKTDQFIKQSLIRVFREVKVGTSSYETAIFDIVLVPANEVRSGF